MPDETHPAGGQPTRRTLLGYVWVDSGQLVIVDPSYLDDLDCESLSAATDLARRAALINDGMAAAVRSGIRNGRYPVYVTTFENGAIARVEIAMDERPE